ncbi:MAG: hypothetical protein MI919_13895, partial [Holophagales bacterium]|nr:hypothetical protein [Holophagales bacterium]
SGGHWAGKAYALPKNLSFYLELALALYSVACFVLAIELGMWLSLPFLWLFVQGYVYMAWLGLRPTVERWLSPGTRQLESGT